jgi:hypothetical protein
MSSKLSFESSAPKKAIDRIRSQSDGERSEFIIDIFTKYFGDGIRSNPTAFRGRFRKMAATPFNFYRGSTLLFYQDLKIDQDPWVSYHPPAGKIFIHVNKDFFFLFLNLIFRCYDRVIYMLKILEHI